MLVSHCPVGNWQIWLRMLSLTRLGGRWEQDTPPHVCHVALSIYYMLLFLLSPKKGLSPQKQQLDTE